MAHLFAPKKIETRAPAKSGETDLNGLLESSYSKKWDLPRLKQLVSLRQQGLSPKEISEQLQIVRPNAVSGMLSELRRAAREGYTLEAYLEAGRPCCAYQKKFKDSKAK